MTKTPDHEAAVLAKIAGWPDPHRAIGERLHAVITRSVAGLTPRLWYGMPGYAKSKSSPVLCFFRVDEYVTFGLTEKAHFSREEGAADQLMECAWFLTELDQATEDRIAGIVRRAAGAAPG